MSPSDKEFYMNIQNIQKKLETQDYQFLKTDPVFKDQIILLTVAGSIAYGTSIESSDLDIRGVAIEQENVIMGLHQFEQYTDKNTDTVIFGLKKFVKLCLNGNPIDKIF